MRSAHLLPTGGRLVSNSVKYRDTSAPHATGRSGSARLEGAALLGADGVTLLTITTGSLDDPRGAPGEIVKAQLKVFGPGGELLFVENHNRLSGGGTQAFMLRGLPAGARIQVQANVRGIDRNRTDVVTLTETVKAGAALGVDVQLPDGAIVGQPVVITGTVSETNGQVGTRTDCQLWVNGALVDQATGIWVDAGDAVTCAFTWTFDRAGEQDVEVRLGDGDGGTTDLGLVRDGGTVTVTSGLATAWSAQAEDRAVNNTTVYEYAWSRADGSHKEYSNTETTTQRTQTIGVQGTLNRAVLFPLASVSFSMTSGGVEWQDEAWTGLESALDGLGRQCVSRDIPLHGAMFFVCNGLQGGASWGYQRFAGRVTYHSQGYSRVFDVRDGVDNVYTWNDSYNTSESGGRIRDLGTAVALHLTIEDGAGSVTFTPTVPQSPFSGVISTTPRTCTDTSPYWLEGGVLTTCTSASVDEAGTRGSTSG